MFRCIQEFTYILHIHTCSIVYNNIQMYVHVFSFFIPRSSPYHSLIVDKSFLIRQICKIVMFLKNN